MKKIETPHKRYTAYKVEDSYRSNLPHVNTVEQHKEVSTLESAVFVEFLNKWGMVAAVPDGEDSSGRSKVRLMTTIELTKRAEEVTKLAFKTIRENGWLEQTVDLAKLQEDYQNELIAAADSDDSK